MNSIYEFVQLAELEQVRQRLSYREGVRACLTPPLSLAVYLSPTLPLSLVQRSLFRLLLV